MLVFEGSKHVGQLQFRPYVPDTVTPKGIMDPLYWADFSGYAPRLPERTLALFCYHVGQLDNTSNRDSRYFGKGIGARLLVETVAWAASAGFEAVVAKGCPPFRPVIEFMGGLPTEVYETHGFVAEAGYLDPYLRPAFGDMLAGRHGPQLQSALMEIVDSGVDLDEAAGVSVCVRRIS
jgi:GNAT superfamily N-acetyltransferase